MKLKDFLAREGMTAAEFAHRIEMSEGTVSLLARDLTWPSRQTAQRILKATRGAVTPGDFLEAAG